MGRRCPALLPAHCGWPGAPQPAQEITGAPRGRPCRPCSEAAQGGKEAIVGLCFSFHSIARAPRGPWELTKLPPTRSCPASPSPTLGTGPLGPGLLKWQVQSGNEVMSKLGVGRTWARAGWAGTRMDGHRGLCLHPAPPSPRSNSRGADIWTERMSEALSVQQRNQRKETQGKEATWTCRAPTWVGRTVRILEKRHPRSSSLCSSASLGVWMGVWCTCVYVCICAHVCKCVHMCPVYMWVHVSTLMHARAHLCVCACV